MVLAIVGILMSMAVSRYQSFTVQREVNDVAYKLAESIEVARISAQSHGKNVIFCPVTSEQLYTSLTKCPDLKPADPWQAWVIMELDNQNQGRVLVRSNMVSANVLVCIATSSDDSTCNNNPESAIRIIDGMGYSHQDSGNGLNGLVTGFTIKVAAGVEMQDVFHKIVVLAPNGRVTLKG